MTNIIKNYVSESNDIKTYAQLYGFIAQLFNQIPDLDLVNRLRKMPSLKLLESLEDIDESIYIALKDIQNFISDTMGQSAEAVQISLAKDWTRLFRGVSPTYGPPPPFEAEYSPDAPLVTELLKDLNRTYKQYGVEIQAEYGSRPDYIGVELDFLHYLLNTEGTFISEQDQKKANSIELEIRAFLNDHLRKWVKPFCERALPEARTDFYRGLLHLTQGIVYNRTIFTEGFCDDSTL